MAAGLFHTSATNLILSRSGESDIPLSHPFWPLLSIDFSQNEHV